MTDEWVRERALKVADFGERERHNLGFHGSMAIAADTALREAITRTREAERALAAEALKQLEAKLARLKNPDEELIEAVSLRVAAKGGIYSDTLSVLHALAATLDKEDDNAKRD